MNKLWKYIKIAIGTILAIFICIFLTKGIDKSEIKKKIKEVKIKAKEQEKIVEKVKENMKDRKKRAETLAERLKKYFNIFIILTIILFLNVGVIATDTIENLRTPETYEELLEAYQDMAEIAIGYQKLYNEAEADNQTLLKVIENLQSLMKVQQDIIDTLLQKNRFSVLSGVSYTPLNPSNSSLILGVTWEF